MKISTPRTALLLATLLASTLLSACSTSAPVPDWQSSAHSAIERANAAYLEGNPRVEAAEYRRARAALTSTGNTTLVIRAELIRCAVRVAALDFDECSAYVKLAADAADAERAYAAYLSGHASDSDTALLPPAHRQVATAGTDTGAASAVQAISDPLARLVASAVLLRSGKATPQLLNDAVDTASAQGWRRPLLAWLGVQALRASEAGDTAQVQRLQRRIALITEKTG